MPSQKDKISRHAHYLESYYNGEANKVDAFLRRVAKRLRIKLTQTQTVTSQARIKTLLDFTENLVKEELGAFTDGLQEQIELFADSEARFAAAAIKDLEMVIPSPQQTAAAVYARPFNNRLLKDYLKDFTRKVRKYHTVNISAVKITVFRCVPFPAVLSLYFLHCTTAPITVEKCKH